METGFEAVPALALTGSGWTDDRGDRAAADAVRGALTVSEQVVEDVPPPLREEWQRLAGRSGEANAFAEPWFVGAGLRNLADGPVRLLEARDDRGGLAGVMLLCIRRNYGRVSVRHVENWRHHHDFLATPLVRAGYEKDFWRAVLTHLDAASWAPGFLHVNGLVENHPLHTSLEAAARSLGRCAPVVHRSARALLESGLSPQAYYETHVRKKKRKELKRLQKRLEELGTVEIQRLGSDEPLAPWCDDFLALERSGWKGEAGSALACAPGTEAFFRDAVEGARAAGRLQMLKLTLDGRPLAMLVNFLTPPGSFSFKIAHDEAFARFSPGVLIQLANLDILSRPDIAWMDSCAAENHAMIDHLWAERRSIVRVTVPLSGLGRGLAFRLCRTLEQASALRRRMA